MTNTPDDNGLIFARVLNGAGGAVAIDANSAANWTPNAPAETLWLHFDRTVDAVDDWLARIGVSEATIEVLTSDETRPRAFREGNTIVTILRGINLNPGAEPEDMVALQIWASDTRVVSLRRRKLQTPLDVADSLDAGDGPRTAGDLLAELVEQLVAKMNVVIVEMNDRIDQLEAEDPDDDPADMMSEIADIRRNCLALKRYMSPQHDALQQLLREPLDWLGEANRRDIRETIDRLRRYLEELDVSKESAIVLQDDLNNRATNQSNKTMYMLSIVAAIFLPLSFVTGLLGINVGGMPGVQSGDAFWITVGALGVLFAIQIAIFRKVKWL